MPTIADGVQFILDHPEARTRCLLCRRRARVLGVFVPDDSQLARLRPDLIAIAPPWHGFRDTAAGLVAMLVHANAIPAAQGKHWMIGYGLCTRCAKLPDRNACVEAHILDEPYPTAGST